MLAATFRLHISSGHGSILGQTCGQKLLQCLLCPASRCNLVCRSTNSQLESGSQVKVKGKRVTSMFGGWGVKKKVEQTFAPGSPVIIRGKVLSKNGARWRIPAFPSAV